MERKFGFRDKIGYMFGDFGNDFFFMLASTFLMVFYTKVLGISAAAVGTLFLVARCVDAFTDITMGHIVDTARIGKDGKFRPWIRRMCIPVVVAGVLMFNPFIADKSMTFKMVFILPIYSGEVSAIQESTFLMVPWRRELPPIQSRGASFPHSGV